MADRRGLGSSAPETASGWRMFALFTALMAGGAVLTFLVVMTY